MDGHKTTSIWPELAAILLARLGFLWLLVLIALLLPHDDLAFPAFMGIAFIVTIPYSLWMRSKLRTAQFTPLQFAVDLVVVSGVVYFTGGIRSDLVLLYPLVILSSGIVGTPRQAGQITLLSMAIYSLMATLIANGHLVEYRSYAASLRPELPTVAVIIVRDIIFACSGVASIYIAKRCNYMDAHENDLSETLSRVLARMPAPTLVLAEDGRILSANEYACSLLARKPEELCSLRFADLVRDGKMPIPESFGKSAYLAKAGGGTLPIAYGTGDIDLPGNALPGERGRKEEWMRATLLVFADISHPMEIQRHLEKVEHITSATRLAGEMAHEIRTPLTALSASIQLLRRYEEQATASDWLPHSPRRRDRQELFDHIEDASVQMETVVKNFVDFAEFSPADLLSIIRLDSNSENRGYISHLNTIGRGFQHGENSHSG